jgi:hypothetical protein
MTTEIPPEAVADVWHICWQTTRGRNLINDASLIERIRLRLIHAHDPPGRALFDFLLTPSELHVISGVRSAESPVHVAREVANVVARWVRETDAMPGPVFAGPYRAHRLVSGELVRQEFRMLAWRPVTLGLCKSPMHYSHSALRTTLGVRPAMGFDARPMLNLFSQAVPLARAAARALIAKRPTPGEVRRWEFARGLVLATGTVGPQPTMAREVRGAAAELVALAGQDGIDGALRLLEAWVLVKLGAQGPVDLQVAADALGVRARALVACLALDHGLCSAASVARHFHRAKATLSEQMSACRARSADQQILRTSVDRIVEEAAALPPRTR